MTLSRRMATALATSLIAAVGLLVSAGAPAQGATFGCFAERAHLQNLRTELTALGRELSNPNSSRSQDEINADIAFVDSQIDLAIDAYNQCMTDQGVPDAG